MAIGLVKDSSVPRTGFHNGFGGIIDEGWRRERAPRLSESVPKGSTQVLAVCTAPGQLEYCVALAL
jgi:hypothetical protein